MPQLNGKWYRLLYMIEFDLQYAKTKYKEYPSPYWDSKVKEYRKERIEWLNAFQPNWREDAKKLSQRFKTPRVPRMDDWTEELENFGDNPNNDNF